MIKKIDKKIIGFLLIIVVSALTRVLPHEWNFSPILAIFVISAGLFQNNLRWIFPFAALLISDVFIQIQSGQGFYTGIQYVYISYACASMVSYFLFKNFTLKSTILTSLVASTVFYIVSNFALFYPSSSVVDVAAGKYPHSFEGIKASYLVSIPYFRNSIVSTTIYSVLFYFLVEMVHQSKFKVAKIV
ncbi:MAG: DUF6580 family putative transport protein [Leadbetterella sp.]